MANPRITLADLPKPKRGSGPEAQVTAQCVDFLESHGWRAIRMNRGMARYGDRGVVTYGEPGQADWIFVRYGTYRPILAMKRVELMFIEFKSPTDRRKCICRTKKPRTRCTPCDQQNWRVREQARGAVVLRIESLEQLMSMEVWK